MCRESRNFFTSRCFLVLVLAFSALSVISGAASATQNPPNCNANLLDLDLARDKVDAVPGETVNFTVTVSNQTSSNGDLGCDVQDVTIAFTCPGPTGDDDGPSSTLITGASYAADPPQSQTFGPIPCVMPNINGAALATAEANGELLDNPVINSDFVFSKSISVNVTPCDVQVDKQVSCDGGTTWFDVGLVDNNEDGTTGCAGLDNSQILVRYSVKSSGESSLFACDLDESNALFGGGVDFGNIAPGATSGPIAAALTPQCKDAVGNEPNTATVSCFCTADLNPNLKVTASDTTTFECLTPAVKVDKQISCNGGLTFVDPGLVAMDEDGTNNCTALDGTIIQWQYQAANVGTAPLFDCALVDSNAAVSPAAIQVGSLGAGVTSAFVPATNTVACSDTLEGQEPDTVTLTCCSQDVASLVDCPDANKVTAFDAVDVVCQSKPELLVLKVCEDKDGNGTDEVTVTASATAADLNLVNCSATDNIFLDDPSCPADQGSGTPVPLTPANPFDITAGTSVELTGSVGPLSADACNTVSVTCTIQSTAQTVTDTADALCPGQGQGCLTRTPGFWATHPHITSLFLSQQVCGIDITTVEAGDTHSATEAMCSVGKDGKLYEGGPQQAQLVRQCMAAALNVAATLEAGGNCTTQFVSLATTLDACCDADSACTGNTSGSSVQHCIDVLDAFNNSLDSIASAGTPFESPGPADPTQCQDAKNNSVIVQP